MTEWSKILGGVGSNPISITDILKSTSLHRDLNAGPGDYRLNIDRAGSNNPRMNAATTKKTIWFVFRNYSTNKKR